jgi:hypothetical protein
MLHYAFYMYWGEKERVEPSFAYKLGLHPSTLALLSDVIRNFEK